MKNIVLQDLNNNKQLKIAFHLERWHIEKTLSALLYPMSTDKSVFVFIVCLTPDGKKYELYIAIIFLLCGLPLYTPPY